MGGMPYDVFTKLFDSPVWPTISYGVYRANDQFNEFGLSQFCNISNPVPK